MNKVDKALRRDLLAICLATIAFTLWGYFWYATLLDDVWQDLINTSEADLIAMAARRGSIQHVLTLLISLIQVIGVYMALRWSKAASFAGHIAVSLVLSVLIILPALGNATLFAGTPMKLLLLDFVHFCLGYAGIAFVFFLISSKKSNGPKRAA